MTSRCLTVKATLHDPSWWPLTLAYQMGRMSLKPPSDNFFSYTTYSADALISDLSRSAYIITATKGNVSDSQPFVVVLIITFFSECSRACENVDQLKQIPRDQVCLWNVHSKDCRKLEKNSKEEVEKWKAFWLDMYGVYCCCIHCMVQLADGCYWRPPHRPTRWPSCQLLKILPITMACCIGPSW